MNLSDAFGLAVQHFQTGRLGEAEHLCRQILGVDPRHSDALHLLGVIAHHAGRSDLAVDFMRQACAGQPGNPELHSNLGEAYRKCGRLEEAIAAYRRALQLQPDYAVARCNLGCALADQGRAEEAIAECRSALRLQPQLARAHYVVGNALVQLHRIEEAIGEFRRALAIDPSLAEAQNNLGNALTGQGRVDEGLAAYRAAIQTEPGFAAAHFNLGNTLRDQDRLDEAVAAYRQAVALQPDYAEAQGNLGSVLARLGRLDEAIAAHRLAVLGDPALAQAHNNLGNALTQSGRLDDGIAAFRRALELRPDFAEAHSNLGNALKAQGRLDEAIAAFHRALELRPDFAEVFSNLGNAWADQGRIEEALAAYRRSLALRPEGRAAHANLLFSLHSSPASDAAEIFREHARWDEMHARALALGVAAPANDPDPDRRLRIGYVSPDFRTHSVAYFLEPLLAAHDPAQVEIFAYADLRRADAVTARLRAHVSHWREITGLTDEQAAALIRRDRIDILVDLAGHTEDGRLLIFARRPAPVQVTYLGYCDTTGLQAMDYRLTDAEADPPGLTEHLHTERLVRLPEGAWCYRPREDAPPVGALPALETGGVTFGCFNAQRKITGEILRLWSRILRAVPGARLLLKNLSLRDESVRAGVRAILEKEGIAASRVELLAQTATPAEHLGCYQRVDVALDSFPYHGTATTCEALWMGVPVITLAGATHVSRVGVSLLSRVGLAEMIAPSPEEYVRLAVTLAADLPRLAALRASLRERMAASPLLDGPRFARHVEAAYRQMWRTWCAQRATLS